MEVEFITHDNMLIVVPAGTRIDSAVSAEFKGKVMDYIISGQRRLVLDLSMIDFIDSSGLGTLISLLKNLGKEGKIVLCGVTTQVNSLFRLTRVERIFHITATRAEAIVALTG